MLAFLYLCVCAITGMVLVAICVPDVRRLYLACAPSVKAIENIPSTLFVVSAGTVTGMLCVPFVNYYVILGLSYIVASDKLCMKISFMVTAALFLWLVLTCLILVNKRRIRKEEEGDSLTKLPQYVNKPSNTLFYSFSILLTTVIAAFLMFYTYRIDRGSLLNGYSTFSDLSPHTAMVSSFGKGFNFPSEYMHFSGDGIKYHFLFYFLAGMLEYLGFPIDYALNVPSIISMVCAMVLLGLLASLLSGRRLAFAISPILVFLRSSLNVFIHIGDLISKGQTPIGAISEIMSESSWYGTTPYDEWGVWAINVYPNQRHFMLGIAVVLICVILFIPFVRRLCISVMSADSFGGFFKAILFSRNAWLPRKNDPLSAGTVALFSCILVIVMPYFHGSCLISLLLVLFGMALVSESRLLHLMVAVCAVVSSYIQTLVFSGGAQNVLTMQYNPGFLLSETSKPITSNVILSWGTYIVTVTGATLLAAELCTVILLIHDIIKRKPVYRFFLSLAFLNPMIFAFFFQVTREMLANHKFIQVSIILIDAFVALFLANLFIVPGRRKAVAVAASDDSDEDIEDDEEETEDVIDAKALEANIEKAAKEGELAPVTEEETKALEESVKKEPEEVQFGDDEGPFEVITDSGEETKDLPEEIITDGEEKSEDKKEDLAEDKDSDSRLLEKIPSERTVSMRPGSVAIAEDAAKTEEAAKESSAESNDADDADDAEVAFVEEKAKENEDRSKDSDSDIPSERTVGMRPGAAAIAEETAKTEETDKAEDAPEAEKSEKKPAEESKDEGSSDKEEKVSDAKETASEKEETEESEDDLPFEVLDDEDSKDKEESKELAEKPADEDKTEATDAEDKNDEADEADEEDEKSDMVLEHAAIEPAKAKGLPGPVWAIFEIFGVLAALILLVALVGTGISEWATYININSTPMAVSVNSPVTEWIEKNTEPNDVFLTPEWSMNRFLLAGRPMYYGWPYYAWSAGHDTNTRDTIYLWLISGCGGDIKEFKRYCKERGIRYLIADPDFDDGDYGEDVFFNREFFDSNLTQVAYFTEENTVIYKIY
ncbi:MAG: hypothetical protein J5777_07650 [Clostridiales bacterium]|nr:hypothetical protein [Clostridiales bacterium]